MPANEVVKSATKGTWYWWVLGAVLVGAIIYGGYWLMTKDNKDDTGMPLATK